jgi:multiple sugar transport system permease protein
MSVSSQAKSPVARKPARKRRGSSPRQRLHARWGLLFISPWIVGLLAFTLIPILATIVFSFTNYSPVTPDQTQFVGLQNYQNVFKDSKVGTSLMVTVRYGILAIPVTLGFGLLLATIVNSNHLFSKGIFRTLFFMPSMIPVVAGALIWSGVMNTQTGWINLGLQAIGIPGPDWLNSTSWIYPALVLIGLWSVGNLMLTLLAGMQGVPSEYYEAAKIDGANGLQCYWHITLPMVSPVIFYNLVLMLIGAFKYFDLAYVLKSGTGGPADATLFYNLNLYKNAFEYNLMGYGSALAWILFIIVLVLTVLLFGSQRYWVYYAGGKD